MCFKVLLSLLVTLTYINFVTLIFMNDDKQLYIYKRNIRRKPINFNFCTMELQLWANYCTFAIKWIAKDSEDYEQMYLDYPAFTSNERNSDKCQNTKLFVPVINELVDLKHLICYGRPIIIRTDEPDENKFRDKISIYIVYEKRLIILEKVDEGKHKMLKSISINVNRIRPFDELLTLPSPHSTFDIDTIKSRMGSAENVLRFERNPYNILKRTENREFKRICYMIFSRREYKYEVKLLPKEKIGKLQKYTQGSNHNLWIFSESAQVNVTMYTCLVFFKATSSTNFRLMAGPDPNSVIVVKFITTLRKNYPYELIENISLKHMDTQVRLYHNDFF